LEAENSLIINGENEVFLIDSIPLLKGKILDGNEGSDNGFIKLYPHNIKLRNYFTCDLIYYFRRGRIDYKNSKFYYDNFEYYKKEGKIKEMFEMLDMTLIQFLAKTLHNSEKFIPNSEEECLKQIKQFIKNCKSDSVQLLAKNFYLQINMDMRNHNIICAHNVQEIDFGEVLNITINELEDAVKYYEKYKAIAKNSERLTKYKSIILGSVDIVNPYSCILSSANVSSVCKLSGISESSNISGNIDIESAIKALLIKES
jgi:hypothetical protein